MSEIELLPTLVSYRTEEPVTIEVRGLREPGAVTVWHLGDHVGTASVAGSGEVSLGVLHSGGYGVELETAGGTARTAVEVSEDPRRRLRYGFVADYSAGRDAADVADTVRRLHLTGIQFYDWAYRHADLLGGGEEYADALGQPVSLDTVRRLATAVQDAGARALGYAAVYAAGPDEWPAWKDLALLTAGGEPYGLGDFLFLVDPAAEPWVEHLASELRDAVRRVGFDGFHLDQYGYPKQAIRPDGRRVDVAESFAVLIERLRSELPTEFLVFNNVNDFPTWRTAHSRQDAVYIEVWEPHITLGSLAAVVDRARAEAEGKPVVVAAYQHVYDSAPTAEADAATALTMATLFSHGATHLFAGEEDRVLVDPYYVRNHRAAPSTAALLKRWYDFLVEHDELLLDHGLTDVTGSYAGAYNDDCDVAYRETPVTGDAAAGTVWRRITRSGDRLIIHLINLAGQDDTLWDGARRPAADPGPGTLRVRRTDAGLPRVRVADPDRSARLMDVPVTPDGDHARAELPSPHLWQLVIVDPATTGEAL